MKQVFDPFRLLLISVAGWLGQQQRDAIDYLQEENRALREQLGNKRLRLSNDQRRRLAAKAKKLGWCILREVATIVTPVPPVNVKRSEKMGLRILHHLRGLMLGVLIALVAAALSFFKTRAALQLETLRSGANWAFCIVR